MGFLLLVFPLMLIVTSVASYFISARIYKDLVKKENGYAMWISIGSFIGCFTVIGLAIFYLLINNISFSR